MLLATQVPLKSKVNIKYNSYYLSKYWYRENELFEICLRLLKGLLYKRKPEKPYNERHITYIKLQSIKSERGAASGMLNLTFVMGDGTEQ